MVFSAGKGRGDEGGAKPVGAREKAPEDRVRQVQEHMEHYIDLVRQKAPADDIKQAEQNLQKEMGKDSFAAFKRELPHHLHVRRSLDAQVSYQHFRLPGRNRVVHDHRGHEKEAARHEHARDARHAGMHVRDGKLIKERVRDYVNYLGDRMRAHPQAQQPAVRAQLDELLSKFERLVIQRFEGNAELAKGLEGAKPVFLPKTEKQWKQFFEAFAGRVLKKSVSQEHIKEFLFRGLVQRGEKGIVISDMTLQSGRIEKFIRFSILADAMAKLNQLIPGDTFGKEMLATEELMYLALAVARGREYQGQPKPAQGLFMGGIAEERAAQALGLPVAQHLDKTDKGKKGKPLKGFGGFGGGKDREVFEELPQTFVPWWHWGNLGRPGKFTMVTVAFYIALGVITVIGIIAVTAQLLK